MGMRIKADDFDGWSKKVDSWGKQTLWLIANKLSYQEAVQFQYVKHPMVENFIYNIGQQHNEKLQALATSIANLEVILSSYREYWGPPSPEQRARFEAVIIAIPVAES